MVGVSGLLLGLVLRAGLLTLFKKKLSCLIDRYKIREVEPYYVAETTMPGGTGTLISFQQNQPIFSAKLANLRPLINLTTKLEQHQPETVTRHGVDEKNGKLDFRKRTAA
ncbi:hypothetical protein Rs2_15786 [Raphanus sativus]|nr:hypothetical protein Rs2_15786 [Raphanus sativus]